MAGGSLHHRQRLFMTAVASDGVSPEFETNAAANLLARRHDRQHHPQRHNSESGRRHLSAPRATSCRRARRPPPSVLATAPPARSTCRRAWLFQRRRAVHDWRYGAGTGGKPARLDWSAKSRSCRGAHSLAGALNGGANDFSSLAPLAVLRRQHHHRAEHHPDGTMRCRWARLSPPTPPLVTSP